MIDATAGEVLFENVDIQTLKRQDLRRVRTKIGMIFQHFNLVYRLTVIENVLHGRAGLHARAEPGSSAASASWTRRERSRSSAGWA